MNLHIRSSIRVFLSVSVCSTLLGCATILNNVTSGLANDLSTAILSSEDPEIVADGLPSYILLIDSFVSSPRPNPAMLRAAAELNGAYATAFVDDLERQRNLAAKAFDYAQRAFCIEHKEGCEVVDMPMDRFKSLVLALDTKDLEGLYVLGASWAGVIQLDTGDWEKISQLARVKIIMNHVLDVDETHADGAAHMYVGAFESLLPEAMGGRPALAKEHFEAAVALSDGNNHYAKLLYAEMYARLVFDRQTHDRLLGEILASDPRAGEFTLQNHIARDRARVLLNEADDFF